MSNTYQPRWKCVANLGGANPVDYGGAFVYIDKTGRYDPELEILEAPEGDVTNWTVYRVCLEKHTFVGGILSDNEYHPNYPAWYASDVSTVADYVGTDTSEMVDSLCSNDAAARAKAYQALLEYFGPFEFDQDPRTFTKRGDVTRRYRTTLNQLARLEKTK